MTRLQRLAAFLSYFGAVVIVSQTLETLGGGGMVGPFELIIILVLAAPLALLIMPLLRRVFPREDGPRA